MEIRCRKEHASRFVDLDFSNWSAERIQPEGVVTMVDEEANYAHTGEMPTDIPWEGWSDGGSYGSFLYACDGKALCEVSVGENQFCVEWDYDKMEPKQSSVQAIREFFACKARAIKEMTRQELAPEI